MKRIFTLLALAAFALTIVAQSPDLMTYQAVLRDAENHLLTNQGVAIQISIMQGTPNGAPVYIEVHTVNTNANGLVSLEIGDGVTGDDFSLVDWSSGPFFLKTETDPTGGSNYTITTTTQLLSVPFAKYADEAGNVFSGVYADLSGSPIDVSEFVNDAGYLTTVNGSETAFDDWDKNVLDDFSGNYAHLTGAPTALSAFTNDAGYLTGVTGSEIAFDDWDKNVLDDFSGNYADLSGAPTVVSAFTNDAGYLTSELWSQNGTYLYYLGGRIGIGTSTPITVLNVNSGAADSYALFHTTASGSTAGDGFLVGTRPDFNTFIWNFENGPIFFGTNGIQRMVIESGGDIGIGVSNPDATLEVNGDTKFGSNGIAFTELREITGTTGGTGTTYVSSTLPSGYTEDNTRVLSVQINWGGYGWVGLGMNHQSSPDPIDNVSYLINGTTIYVYYPDVSYTQSVAYRVLIMQIAP